SRSKRARMLCLARFTASFPKMLHRPIPSFASKHQEIPNRIPILEGNKLFFGNLGVRNSVVERQIIIHVRFIKYCKNRRLDNSSRSNIFGKYANLVCVKGLPHLW